MQKRLEFQPEPHKDLIFVVADWPMLAAGAAVVVVLCAGLLWTWRRSRSSP